MSKTKRPADPNSSLSKQSIIENLGITLTPNWPVGQCPAVMVTDRSPTLGADLRRLVSNLGLTTIERELKSPSGGK